MGRVCYGAPLGLRYCVLGLAAIAAALTFTSDRADAEYRHRYRVLLVREAAAESYSPLFASIVVDGNSGEVLHAANADAPRHPASLTKIMTLYLLFERLDAGKIRLDSPLRVSERAAEQAPTKLGLKPGQTIVVEDAIKAVVTKSANDAAVAIAENLAGSEDEFARLMTQKAQALGMNRTTYVNASGLPNDEQVTTARDQALLGRAIQERFPRYYRYFSTEEFVYHGSAMRNHNHLLGEVGGVDGIKTGYTRASGFNLVTSVHRDGRYIVAVVLGGRSAAQRDARMRELISAHIKEAARRAASVLTDNVEPSVAVQAAIPPKPPAPPMTSRSDPAPTASTNGPAIVGSSDPIQPVLVKTIPYRAAPAQAASFALTPAPVTAAAAPPQPAASAATHAPAPAQPAAVRPPVQPSETPSTIIVASAEPAAIAATSQTDPAKTQWAKADIARTDAMQPPIRAHAGWLIQVGAFEDENEARQHLSAAQLKVPAMLAHADSFTERVQKGDKSLYRARFAVFDRATAEATCKLLKRSDIDCMALKN
jgi:D-alanyl-D-alanine carboxypeptidase